MLTACPVVVNRRVAAAQEAIQSFPITATSSPVTPKLFKQAACKRRKASLWDFGEVCRI
jgi:hypothetical protein